MSYKVLIPQDVAEIGKRYLTERGYEIKMGSGIGVEKLKKDVSDCHAILARTASYPADVLKAGTNLKVISRHGVGVDNIDVETATKLGIFVTNAPESNADSVAEHTTGLILAVAKNLVRCDRETRNGNFEIRYQLPGVDCKGKVLGLVGLGRVGKLVAGKARLGLGMEIIGYDPYISSDSVPGIEKVECVEEIFRRADFVSLHIPATEKTKGLVCKAHLELMKPAAFLINAARGGIVNEHDLVEVLRENRIAGAALDVFAEEPPQRDNPLFSLNNVVLTPHNAALTTECMDRMALHAAMGIDEVLSGKQPTWPVNNPGNR